MLIKCWTKSRPQWLRNASQRLPNESIRNGCFTVVTIGTLTLGHVRRGDWEFTFVACGEVAKPVHYRRLWRPRREMSRQMVLDASDFRTFGNGSESVAENPTALSPRVSLADFDGHGSETTHVESVAGRFNLRRRADAGRNLVVLLIGASAGRDDGSLAAI